MHKLRLLIALVGIGVLCSGCVMSSAAASQIRTSHNNKAADMPSQSTFGWGNLWWSLDDDDVLSIKGSAYGARDHKTHYVGFMNADGGPPQRTHYYQEHHLLLQVQAGAHPPPEGATYDAIIDLILEWKVRKHTIDSDRNFIPYDKEHRWLAYPEDLKRYRGKVKVYIDYEAEKLSNNGRYRTPERWRISLFESEIARVGNPDESIRVKGFLEVRHADKTGLQHIDSHIEKAVARLSIAEAQGNQTDQ